MNVSIIVWLAKYWNTHEIIDVKLKEIKKILYLNKFLLTNYIDNGDVIENYDLLENFLFNYLQKVQQDKITNLEEVETIYQIKSKYENY